MTVAEAVAVLKTLQGSRQVRRDRRLGGSVWALIPKKSDQMVRGVVRLPHGTGRTVRVLVFAKGEKETGGTRSRC